MTSVRYAPLAFVVVVAATTGSAHAQADINGRSYFVGGRAASMGGAYVALADDESGWFYNPAGVAAAARSSMSMSVSLYGLARGSYQDAFGVGLDFSYQSLNVVPSMVGSVKKINPRLAIGFGVFSPSALSSSAHVDADSGDTLLVNTQDQTLWAGPGIAYQLTPRLRIGITGFGLLRTVSNDLTYLLRLAPPDDNGAVGSFYEIRVVDDRLAIGLAATIGAQWQPHDNVTLGLAVRTPAVTLHDRDDTFFAQTTVLPGNPAELLSASTSYDAADSLPRFQASAGVAARPRPGLVVSGDYVFTAGDDAHVRTHDGSLGAELAATSSVRLRAGAFTNRATTPSDVAMTGLPHINQFGGALGLGLVGEHTETSLGVSISHGNGTAQGANQDAHEAILSGEGLNYRAAAASQTAAYVFLGTSYRY